MIYTVTIRATVTKDEVVEANSKEEAIQLAHEQFTAAATHQDEDYKEECLEVKMS